MKHTHTHICSYAALLVILCSLSPLSAGFSNLFFFIEMEKILVEYLSCLISFSDLPVKECENP